MSVVAIFAIFAILLLRSPLNRAALFNQRGYTEKGGFIGITTGMDKYEALKNLRTNFRGLDISGPNRDKRCFDMKLSGDEFIQAYDSSWRGGTICVAFSNDRVKSIAWNFNSFAV